MKNTWPILAAAAAGAAYLFRDQIKGFFSPATAAATPASAAATPAAASPAGDSTASGASGASDRLFGTDTQAILPAVTPKLDQIQSSPYLANGTTPAPATGTAGNNPSQPTQTVLTAHKRQEARQEQRNQAEQRQAERRPAAAPKVKAKK